MNLEHYSFFSSFAKKIALSDEDGEDIMQSSLLVAFQENRLDFSQEPNRKWFTGVLKNQAAMLARTEVRRKQRESAMELPAIPDEPEFQIYNSGRETFLKRFPRSARTVLVLILAGLNRHEICALLNLTSATLRQRIRSIKKVVANKPIGKEALALSYNRRTNPDDLALGLIRRSVRRLLKGEGIGTHDPDGHPIILNLK